MAYYVCNGAKLKCSMSSEQLELEVVHLEKPALMDNCSCGCAYGGAIKKNITLKMKEEWGRIFSCL
jgi:hypothetical protein